MKFKDIREFIAFLEDRGELARVKTPVSCDLEITEINDRVVKSGGPALLFENVQGYDIPVLINTYGSAQRTAWALGVEQLDDLADRVRKLLGLMQGASRRTPGQGPHPDGPDQDGWDAAEAGPPSPMPGGSPHRPRRRP